MSSWKKQGGTKRLESFNHLKVNSLVTDDFTLTNNYKGTLNISGDLIVQDDAIFNGNIDVNKLNIGTSINIDPHEIFSNTNGIGINTTDISAAIDISSNNDYLIRLKSNAIDTKSDLIVNNVNSSIQLALDTSNAFINLNVRDRSANIIYNYG